MSFTGFSHDTFRFLKALEKNNNRPWFDLHREDFQRHVLGPFGALVASSLTFYR